MTDYDTLPIKVTKEQMDIPCIISGLAQRAFRAANYDMSPDDPVETAFNRGLLQMTSDDTEGEPHESSESGATLSRR